MTPYLVGIGVAGTRACVVVERAGRRHALPPWETGAQSTHAAALIAIERATKGAVKTGDILTAYQAAQQLTAARRRRGHAQAAE